MRRFDGQIYVLNLLPHPHSVKKAAFPERLASSADYSRAFRFFCVKQKSGINKIEGQFQTRAGVVPGVNECCRNMLGCLSLRSAYVDYE